MSYLPHNANDRYFFLLGVCLTGIAFSGIIITLLWSLRCEKPIEPPGYTRR